MTLHDGNGDRRVEPRFGLTNDPRQDFHDIVAKPESRLRGKLLGAFVALAAVAGFVGIAWYATKEGQIDSSIVVPMIRADTSPIKVLPAKPGSQKVPNQDKLIFMQVTPDQKKPKVERLMPPPEKPMSKPLLPQNLAKMPPSKSTELDAGIFVSSMPPPPTREPARLKPITPKYETLPKVPLEQPKLVKPASRIMGLAKPQASGIKPVASVARGTFRIQLGVFKSKERAAKEVGRLTEAYKLVLSSLVVKSIHADLGKRGYFYRLRAGPLADRTAAVALCAKLKARKQGCIVIKP